MKSQASQNKVFISMSGGVDSSVAALLLKKQGYDAVGVFMRCYNLDGCAEQDAEDARRVAEKLKIPFYVFDFEKEYKKRVVEYMIEGYRNGITPNPDVMCNKEIKFGLFLKKALELDADYVATGHYVKIQNTKYKTQHDNSKLKNKLSIINYQLHIARDKNKDQSYFLWTLTQEQLRHCLFPIGSYLKSEVREIARKASLPTALKKDSQGICFLGKVTLEEFLKQYIPERIGEVLDVRGEKIGEHQGAYFYTIGQRHLGSQYQVASIKGAIKPVYVVEKNIKNNTLVIAEGGDNPVLYKNEIYLRNINFINQQPTRDNGQQVYARVRYRQPLARANLLCSCKLSVASCKLEFDSPVKFVAPGQSAVFYSKEGELLGGGVVK